MQSRSLHHLPQDHLDRLRHARRRGPGRVPRRRAVHLSVTRTDEELGHSSSAGVWDAPGAAPRIASVPAPRTAWGGRRLGAAVVLAPTLFAFLVPAGGGWANASLPWLALVAATATLGALTLASYVPAAGMSWRDTLGCSPCAIVSGGTTVAAAFMLGLAPHQISTALPAVAVALFGLVQRTSSPTICST